MSREWKKLENGKFEIRFADGHVGFVIRLTDAEKGQPIYRLQICKGDYERREAPTPERPHRRIDFFVINEVVWSGEAWNIKDGKLKVYAAAGKINYETHNMLNKASGPIFLPITTPYYCDPSSEAYHCM